MIMRPAENISIKNKAMIFSFKHSVIKQSQSFSTDFSREIKAKKQIQLKPAFGKQSRHKPPVKIYALPSI